MAAIETFGIEKRYPASWWQPRTQSRVALHPLNLRVEEQEIFGLLGANGAGKTTAFKLLLGLVTPSAGSAQILGMRHDDPRVRSRIGFLPEQPDFPRRSTPLQLLMYFAELSGIPSRERRGCAKSALRRVGLEDAAHRTLEKLSKGMRQRVGIAQAILHDPAVMILDEPMSGLDPSGRREVRDLMVQLQSEGRTLIFATHILPDAEALCDRVAVLAHGKLQGVGTVAEFSGNGCGQVEIVWHSNGRVLIPARIAGMARLSSGVHVRGATARVVIGQEDATFAMDAIREAGATLVSLIPVGGTLEEYFAKRMAMAGAEGAPPKLSGEQSRAAGAAG